MTFDDAMLHFRRLPNPIALALSDDELLRAFSDAVREPKTPPQARPESSQGEKP